MAQSVAMMAIAEVPVAIFLALVAHKAREFETAAMPLGPEQRDPLELSQLSGDPRVMKEPDPRQLRA
jgi:hypothetical protein